VASTTTEQRPESAPAATDGPQPLDTRATGFALLLSALWGGNAVAIKAGLDDAPPLRLAWMRFVAGALVTITWAVRTKQPLRPTRSELRPLTGLALLFVVQIAFMNIGQDHTTASHAVVINTTFPLWTGVFAHFFVRGDRLTPVRSLGTLVAYAGIVVVFAQSLTEGGSLTGDVLMLCSAALLGARQVYVALMTQGVSIAKVLLTQTVVGITVFVLAGLMLESAPWVMTERLALSLFYQGIVIAGFGFIGNTWLLKHYLPSGVTAIALTTPIWGVVLSNLVLDEPLSSTLFAGLALVVLGSAVAQVAARKGR
jgi:drug/metabolite transporter (DMT)-like permease